MFSFHLNFANPPTPLKEKHDGTDCFIVSVMFDFEY